MLGMREEQLEREEMEANQRTGMGGASMAEWEEEMGEGDEAGQLPRNNLTGVVDIEQTGEEERDLDADVPDADEAEEDEDEEAEEGDDEGMLDNTGIDLDADIPTGEDSFIDPSENIQISEQDELMMANERDLDDEIPQATPTGDEGEWQHTDTELEDEDESGVMDLTHGGEGSSLITPGNVTTGTRGFSPAVASEGGFAGLMGVGAARTWLSGSHGAGLANTPEQQQTRRTSGPRGRGRENRARESLD